MDSDRNLTLLLLPGAGGRTRTLRISHRRLPWLAGAGVIGLALVLLFVGSWWYLAGRAREATLLEAQVAELQLREVRVAELAATLEEMEEGYARMRSLFGVEGTIASEEL
ncbi:MAG: hypothetical protein WD056_00640, partial [Gemmatimonadota bacterium]